MQKNFFKIDGKFKSEIIKAFKRLSSYYGISVKTRLFSKLVIEHEKILNENIRLKRIVYFNRFKA